MATIHVNRAGTSLGTFTEDEIRDGLRSGRFAGNDLAWKEGMPSWQPLSTFAEFASESAAPTPEPPSPASPPAPVGSTPTPPPGARSGLPWEHRATRGFLSAFVETVTMVLSKPSQAFSIMRIEGGFIEPLLFGVLGGSIGGIASLLMSVVKHSLGWSAAFAQQSPFENMLGAGVGGAMLIFWIILMPILIALGLFIWTALVHLCLMLLGGANKTFETTFRALSFAYGATALFAIVPCCGGLIALIWGLVADCIGISRSHETDIGRAVFAVLLPLVVCCGGIFMLSIMLGVGVGALLQQSGH